MSLLTAKNQNYLKQFLLCFLHIVLYDAIVIFGTIFGDFIYVTMALILVLSIIFSYPTKKIIPYTIITLVLKFASIFILGITGVIAYFYFEFHPGDARGLIMMLPILVYTPILAIFSPIIARIIKDVKEKKPKK